MDVVNSELNNSSNFDHSIEHDHELVGGKNSDQENVVKSAEQEVREFDKDHGSVENSGIDKQFKEENRETFNREDSALEGDFTELDKSSVNFVDEFERAKLVKSPREIPEESLDQAVQVDKSSDESATSEIEESFPKESSSERDSIDLEQSVTMDYPDLKKHFLSISDIQDFVDSRVAEARLEVVENKIDRVLLKIENTKDDHQRELFHVLLARIKDLEDKLDKKSVVPKKGKRLSSELPVEQFSSYVVEKATQTPSEEHDCEGVYVLVSKKNKQQVRQVHRQVAYVLPGESNERSKSVESQSKQPQPKVTKKVIKRVGYPEYLYEESLKGHKGYPEWNKFERKTVAFFPPIPGPYSRRRPRNATYPQNTDFNCSKHH